MLRTRGTVRFRGPSSSQRVLHPLHAMSACLAIFTRRTRPVRSLLRPLRVARHLSGAHRLRQGAESRLRCQPVRLPLCPAVGPLPCRPASHPLCLLVHRLSCPKGVPLPSHPTRRQSPRPWWPPRGHRPHPRRGAPRSGTLPRPPLQHLKAVSGLIPLTRFLHLTMLQQKIKGTLVKSCRSRTINARLPCPQCRCTQVVLWPTRPLSDRRPGALGTMRVTTTQRRHAKCSGQGSPFFTCRGLGKLDVTLVPLCWTPQGGGTTRMSKNKRTLSQTVHAAGIATFCCDTIFSVFFCKCRSIAVLWCQVLWPSHLYRLYDSPFFFSAFFDGLLLASELQYHSEEGKGCSFGCAVAAIFCLKEKYFARGVLCSSTYDRIVMLVYFFSFEKFASWSAALTELRHL